VSFQSSASNLSALFLGLHSDLTKSKENLRPDITGYWDRMYIRCLYSLIEGLTYRMRHALISTHDAGKTKLEISEYILLSELGYRVTKSGKIEETEEFLPFLTGFRLTFKTCCRILDISDYETSAFSHNGWECIKKTIQIRDRLTHPKEPQDLIITKEELSTAQQAERWFLSLVSQVFSCMEQKHA